MPVAKGRLMLRCKTCGKKLQRRGRGGGSHVNEDRTWCKKCDSWDYVPSRHPRPARILELDIETLPGEYYLWSPKQEYAQPSMQIKDFSISCWSAKWLFEPEVMGEVVTPEEAESRTQGSILGKMWKLVDEADIVVTQNGASFDMPRLNGKWIEAGYKPPSEFKHVDTLIEARKLGFTYNRLEELGLKFGIGKKIDMSFIDFRNCIEGDRKSRKAALDHMLEYCKRDVAPLLEDVYLYLLPWMKNHPNLNVFSDTDTEVCRNCASANISWSGQYATPQGLWEGWRCHKCGATGRGSGKDHKIKGVKIK